MSATIHVTTNSPASLAATTDKFVHAISPTVELNDVENGTELIVTDINGEHSAVIHDGYTPQKGVDYWTEEDQAEIQAAIDDVEDAVTAANTATRNAMDAYSSAKNAATSANSAASSANNASAAARDATQRAQSAATTANNAAGTANTAAGNANTAAARANAAASMIEHLEAEAETLPADSEATASFENNKITFGIPVGGKGDKGDPGQDYVLTQEDKAEIAQMTIDDTATAGTTDKTWSADKIAAEIAAGTGVLVELNIARAGTVTTDASIADILADIEAGKHVYGLAHLEGNGGNTANAYAPMLALDLGGMMTVLICTFKAMESEIQVLGADMGGKDTWQMQTQMVMKAVAADLEDRPESFNAMNLPISGLGAPVNATDAATKQYVDEHAGGGTVTDVQVNGTSVLSEGVANIPIAHGNNTGVVKVNVSYGINARTDGTLTLVEAGPNTIKFGASGVMPITPSTQHQSAFYGLAKASGDTTQSQSSNAVGTYTDSAKASIQSMLGISSMLAPSETEGSGASRNYVIGETFTMNGKLYKATIPITENDVITSGVNCAETNVADSKADKTDTVLNTTLSRGRMANTTVGEYSFAFGNGVEASGAGSHAEGISSFATSVGAHAEGCGGARATNYGSHAEGQGTNASGAQAHAEGSGTIASGSTSHSEGAGSQATGASAHAEGSGTTAQGTGSHAEGGGARASGNNAHAEGQATEASGMASHAEGTNTIANASFSHAGGIYNIAPTLYPNWATNTAYEVGDRVNNSGFGYECITANSDATWTASKWKELPSNSDTAFVVGNGNASTRSNAMELKWNGDMALQGDMTLFKGTANEFNVSSLKDADGVEIFDFSVDRQGVVTTAATVADIVASIESGKTTLGHLILAGTGSNLDSYTPLAVSTMGSVMALALGRFDMGDIEIWITGQSAGGTDAWSSNYVWTLKAKGDDHGGFPQSYSANSAPIKNLGAPVDATDAATKQYVDNSVLSQTGLSVVNGQLCISYEEESA